MIDLLNTFSNYYVNPDFRRFQNEFARSIYDSLSSSYASSYNEVKMVTEMSNVINGQKFDRLHFHSKKIHGTRSYVEFFNQDKPTTKEMADMVIISVVTRNKEIIYEKTAFVQNKKEDSSSNWKIDQDQLYLLHNFPTFKGNKGLFKHFFKNEVVFFNNSRTLGTYGLFQAPGEMILPSAEIVYKLQKGTVISSDELRKYNTSFNSNNLKFSSPFFHHPMWEEMMYRFFKHFSKYGFQFSNLPFLNISNISYNIYEFVRNWSLFNIGDLVSIFGDIIDSDLSVFTRTLLKDLGLSNEINLNVEGGELDSNLTVIVAHLSLDEKE